VAVAAVGMAVELLEPPRLQLSVVLAEIISADLAADLAVFPELVMAALEQMAVVAVVGLAMLVAERLEVEDQTDRIGIQHMALVAVLVALDTMQDTVDLLVFMALAEQEVQGQAALQDWPVRKESL
jgi:hypothetical protein